MKGAIIYFSGTGNTEFVADQFKRKFKDKDIECTMIDVCRKKNFKDAEYDFYIFGCVIHAEMFPRLYMDWIAENIRPKNNKKCIVFSTQAGKKGAGLDDLSRKLEKKGLEIIIKEYIKMPYNYYIVAGKMESYEEKEILKENASKEVAILVNKFINNEKSIKNVSKLRLFFGIIEYKGFRKYSLGWAKRRLKVNNELCVKCGKCVKNCPVYNIRMNEEITFAKKCISCQRCLNSCPVDAFVYKNKKFKRYNI